MVKINIGRFLRYMEMGYRRSKFEEVGVGGGPEISLHFQLSELIEIWHQVE